MFDRLFGGDGSSSATTNEDDSPETDHSGGGTPATDTSRSGERPAGNRAESPYSITETSVESIRDIAVRAETVEEGVVAGSDIRGIFENGSKEGEGPLWLGYQKDPHRGLREAPLHFNALFRHLWVSGTTGYGKSTTLLNNMVQLANRGHGFVYVDPKGQDSRDLLRKLPEDRLDDVVWVEPGNLDREDTVGLNFLELPSDHSAVSREEEIETRIETLKAILSNGEYWGINMESITESMGRAMLQSDTQHSLIDMYYILLEADRREDFAETVEDRYLREFCQEIAGMPDKTIRPLLKRLKAWVESPVIRQIIAHKESTIDFREIIDNDRIVIVRTPIENTSVKQMISLGVMRQLWTAVRQRASSQDGQPDPYFLFCDEFDDISSPNLDLEGMLARARSNRLSVTLSCQYPSQLDSSTQDAVRNNCDTTLAFSVNAKSDARILMERFQEYSAEDLLGTGRYQLWTKLPREDKGYSNPVRINTFPPYPPRRPTEEIDRIIDGSLNRHGTPQLTDTEIHEQLVFSDTTGATALHSEVTAELAAAVRAVQLREDSRINNDWVDVKTVDTELARRQPLTQHDLEYNEADLPQIREDSSRLEVNTIDDDSVVRLTDAGETAAKPTTGDVASAGGNVHDDLLFDIEAALTTRGFSVDIREQDGSDQPDATATHPGIPGSVSLEAESTTPSRPANTLANLARAQATAHTPIFVVRPGDPDTELATRIENIFSPPIQELADGTERFYNRDALITFGGGAQKHGGVTAIRPHTPASNRTIWTREDDHWVLSNGDTEFARISTEDSLSKDSLPAYYSYDSSSGQYTVYTPGETVVYHSKTDLEADWTPIKRPFIPAQDLPKPDYNRDSYRILLLPPDGTPKLYQNGTTYNLDNPNTAPEWLTDLSTFTANTHPTTSPQTARTGPTTTEPSNSTNSISGEPSGDGVPVFVNNFVREDTDVRIPQETLYYAYTTWANDHDLDATSREWFTRKLRNIVDIETDRIRVDGTRTRFYLGVTLTDSGHELRHDSE